MEFLKRLVLVYVSKLSQPQNKVKIRAKPSVTSIFIGGHLVENTGIAFLSCAVIGWNYFCTYHD